MPFLYINPTLLLPPITWNTASAPAGVTFTNTNLTATYASSPGGGIVVSKGYTSGKFYLENSASALLSGDNSPAVGLGDSTYISGGQGYIGASDGGHSVGYYRGGHLYINGSIVVTGDTYTTSDILRLAFDIGGLLVWVAVNGGNWNGSGAANPATGVGGASIAAMSGTFYGAASSIGGTFTVTTSLGNSPFSYTVPSGFLAYQH